MKISFVIQDLMSQGAQYATALMVRGFLLAGYEVDLVLSKVHEDLLASGLRPFEVPQDVHRVMLPNRRARENIRPLRKYLSQCKAQAVVSMSPNYTRALRLAALGLHIRPRLVHVEHGLAGLSYGVVLPTPGRFSRKGILNRFLFGGYDRVLTVSAAGREDFLRYNDFYDKSHVAVVYNPVIDAAFFEKRGRPVRHPWLKTKTCPTFVSAGAYQEYKGHFDLLEAICRLKEKGLRFRVVVFGRGPLESDYAKFVAQHNLADMIDFAGYTDQFPAEAAAADGFILPSRRESFGIVLVEALACGCPILATDAPFGPREILRDGKYGKLVAVKSPADLVSGIEALLDGKIARAPDEAWQRFTLEAAVARYEKGIGLK